MIIAPHRQHSAAVSVPYSYDAYHTDPTKIYGLSSAPSSAQKVNTTYYTDPKVVPVYSSDNHSGMSLSDALGTIKDGLSDGLSKIDLGFTDNSYDDGSSRYSSVAPARNSGKTIDYLNADLAKHYGMDRSAAYGEALQNTAYQRAVADLKAAGLNPVLAAGQVSPAGSFVAGNTLSGGSGSGSSGRSSAGTSGRYALSESAYNMLGIVGGAVGTLVGLKVSPAPWKLLGATSGYEFGKKLFQSGAQAFSKFE